MFSDYSEACWMNAFVKLQLVQPLKKKTDVPANHGRRFAVDQNVGV
jgi:hypothetical protein